MNMQQTIANNYMVLDISIGRADPMKHSAVASDAAAAECRVRGNVPVRTRGGALGNMFGLHLRVTRVEDFYLMAMLTDNRRQSFNTQRRKCHHFYTLIPWFRTAQLLRKHLIVIFISDIY